MRTWVRHAVSGVWLLWIGIMIGISVVTYLKPRAHTVYDVYSLASCRWWQGRDIYQVEIERYRYSPLFAIAITPLAVLPDNLGTPLWKIVNVVAFALGLHVLGRRVLPAHLTRPGMAVLFLLALPLALHGMLNGQANLMMSGALMLGLACAVEERWNRAAAWLAVATLIKGYPLALALLLVVLFPRRFSWRFGLAMAVGLLLPFAFQQPGVVAFNYASWFRHLEDSPALMRERMRGLDHVLAIYGLPISPRTFSLLGLLAGLGVCGLCLREQRRSPDRRALLTSVFVLFLCWAMFFGPATECCTYAIMGPAIAWALLDREGQPGWPRRLLLTLSLLLMMGRLATDPLGAALRDFANTHGGQPLGALIFLLCWLTQVRPEAAVVESAYPRRVAA